jgi:hypothetical protein
MVIHTATKADCLNGSPHRYEPTRTIPRRYTKMQCKDCGGYRECTEGEMVQVMSA